MTSNPIFSLFPGLPFVLDAGSTKRHKRLVEAAQKFTFKPFVCSLQARRGEVAKFAPANRQDRDVRP